jgi:multiple sugar transport system permease protein
MGARRVGYYILVAIATALAVFPIYWLVATSFKGPSEWFARPVVWFPRPEAWPQGPAYIQNYFAIFGQPAPSISVVGGVITPAFSAFANSALAAGITTGSAVLIGYMASYAISRYRAGGSFMYFFVFTTRMLPPVAVLIPLLVFFTTLGLVDRVPGLTIIYLGINVAFVIWIVRGFVDDVPREVEEAAALDGVSKWAIPFQIVLPLVKGGLAAAALFVFILSWTEFGVALILTRAQAITIPVQLLKYQSAAGTALGPMAALSVLAVIPAIVLGYLIQKQLVRGLSMGAIRGRR